MTLVFAPEQNSTYIRQSYKVAGSTMINNYLAPEEYQPYSKIYTHESGCCLFLGDISAANDRQFLSSHNIKLVVTAAANMEHVQFDGEVQHVVYSLLDSQTEKMSRYFRQFYELMEQKLAVCNVLVHCFAGISRSATLVISYLMKKNNLGFRDAIAEVRKNRPKVVPNLGFERQLKQYEKYLKNIDENVNRKLISKTSQSRKLHQKQSLIGLPEIVALGRTMPKPKNIEQFSNMKITNLPQTQMQARRINNLSQLKKQRDQQIAPNKIIANFDSIVMRPLRTFRKRSISINKKNSGHLYKVEASRPPPNKLQIHEIKFATEQLLRNGSYKQPHLFNNIY